MKSIDRYVEKMTKRARKIYEKTEDKMVDPGKYEVIETDFGGMRDDVVFRIEVTRKINLKELAVRLIEEKTYFSPWNYLKIRKYVEKPTSLFKV